MHNLNKRIWFRICVVLAIPLAIASFIVISNKLEERKIHKVAGNLVYPSGCTQVHKDTYGVPGVFGISYEVDVVHICQNTRIGEIVPDLKASMLSNKLNYSEDQIGVVPGNDDKELLIDSHGSFFMSVRFENEDGTPVIGYPRDVLDKKEVYKIKTHFVKY